MASYERGLAAARNALKSVPAHTFRITKDGPPDVPSDPYDDYSVHWELRIEPARSSACPLELWFATSARDSEDTLCCGFGFDSWQEIAARLGLKTGTGFRFAFGIEPIHVTESQIERVIGATVAGQAEVRVLSVLGRVWFVNGRLRSDIGLEAVSRKALSLGRLHIYEPYLDA